MLLQDTWNCRVICRRGGSKIRQASSSGGQGHTRSVDGWMLLVVLSARAVLNELVGKRRPEIRRFNLLAVAGEWWRDVSEWQGRGRRGHAARWWRGLATGRARSAERVAGGRDLQSAERVAMGELRPGRRHAMASAPSRRASCSWPRSHPLAVGLHARAASSSCRRRAGQGRCTASSCMGKEEKRGFDRIVPHVSMVKQKK
jgi:hypothetical protein